MRYLCLDYGLKRIGVAISDEDGRMAFPAGVIINRGGSAVYKDIAEKVKKEKISCIVVGLPIGLNGKETDQTKITRSFIALLEKIIHLPVETQNEMLTSRMAVRAGMKDHHIDAASSAIILQSYLDKMNKK